MKRVKKLGIMVCTMLVLALLFPLLPIGEGVAIAQSLERNVIKIGVAAALKRPFGLACLRGAEMAAKEINDAGGVVGAKIQLFSADTEATAPKATEAIEKLYFADKVDTIVGAFSSEEATAFQEESAKLKINILFQGTTRLLDEKYKGNPEKYKYYWNCNRSDYHISRHTSGIQLPLFVATLKEQLGLDVINIAVLTDVSLATERIHVEWQDAVKARRDCKLVYVSQMAREAVDFTAELTAMRSASTQLVLLYSGYTGGYTLVKQAYDVKLPVMMMGSNALMWSMSDFLKAVGLEAAYYNSTGCLYSVPTTPHTAELIKRYERVYGGTLHMTVGVNYNAVKAYAKAVEKAGSLNHDKVQKALEKVRLPESESWNCKAFWFDDTHRVRVSQTDGLIESTFQVYPTGAVKIVEPKEFKTGDLLIPPQMIKYWKKK